MEKTVYTLKVKFIEPVLGSQPTRNVATEHVKTKAIDAGIAVEDEIESIPEELDRGTTVFNKDTNGAPMFFDYQVKGFIKESGRIHNGARGVKNLRSKLDDLLFLSPRRIVLDVPQSPAIEYLERPLRAQTAQGPRTALARSEMLPVGTSFTCTLTLLGGTISEPLLRDILDYGALKGIGQWRNGGYGRFEYELTEQGA